MGTADLIVQARRAAGLSQEDLAGGAGTSRPTLSAYERGWKSPSLQTTTRLLAAAGFELAIRPRTEFVEHTTVRGRTFMVPTRLPWLPVEQALAAVTLPLHLDWSGPRRYDLRDRGQRARVYEIVLREGGPEDLLCYVDGALLVDLWEELVLPRQIRAAWAPLIDPFRARAA